MSLNLLRTGWGSSPRQRRERRACLIAVLRVSPHPLDLEGRVPLDPRPDVGQRRPRRGPRARRELGRGVGRHQDADGLVVRAHHGRHARPPRPAAMSSPGPTSTATTGSSRHPRRRLERQHAPEPAVAAAAAGQRARGGSRAAARRWRRARPPAARRRRPRRSSSSSPVSRSTTETVSGTRSSPKRRAGTSASTARRNGAGRSSERANSPDTSASGSRTMPAAARPRSAAPAAPSARHPRREPRRDHRAHRGRHVAGGGESGFRQRPHGAEMRGRLGAAAAQHHRHTARPVMSAACSAGAPPPARSAPAPRRSPARGGAPAWASRDSSIATKTTCAVWVCRRSPVLTVSAYTSTVMSIEVLPTKSTVASQRHQRSDRDPLPEIHPVDARRHRRPARVPDRRHRRRLVHQRHQLPAEQVAEHVLHVRHDEGGDGADGVGHGAGVGGH